MPDSIDNRNSALLKLKITSYCDVIEKFTRPNKLYNLKENDYIETENNFTQKFDLFTCNEGMQKMIFISETCFRRDLFSIKIVQKDSFIRDTIILDSEKISCLFNKRGTRLELDFGDLICHRVNFVVTFYFDKQVKYRIKSYLNEIFLDNPERNIVCNFTYNNNLQFGIYFQEISLLKNNKAFILLNPIENFSSYIRNIYIVTELNAEITSSLFHVKEIRPRAFTFKHQLTENSELHQINYDYILDIDKIDQFNLVASKKIKKVYIQGSRILKENIDFEII